MKSNPICCHEVGTKVKAVLRHNGTVIIGRIDSYGGNRTVKLRTDDGATEIVFLHEIKQGEATE